MNGQKHILFKLFIITILVNYSCSFRPVSDNDSESFYSKDSFFNWDTPDTSNYYIESDSSRRNPFRIKKLPVLHIHCNESLHLQTNNGSEMLLRIINTSQKNRVYFYLQGNGESLFKSLPPNKPDSNFFLSKDWRGSQLLIANVTDSISPAVISVLLVGN